MESISHELASDDVADDRSNLRWVLNEATTMTGKSYTAAMAAATESISREQDQLCRRAMVAAATIGTPCGIASIPSATASDVGEGSTSGSLLSGYPSRSPATGKAHAIMRVPRWSCTLPGHGVGSDGERDDTRCYRREARRVVVPIRREC